jgi:DMSO reductase family type II enzyme heme b subunit
MRVPDIEVAGETLADPSADVWSNIEPVELDLRPTPSEYLVTKYVKVAWRDRKWGLIDRVTLRAARADGNLFVRLSWRDRSHPEAEFPDACALAFPLEGDAPLETFGSREKPLAMWYWRSDLPGQAEDAIARSMRDITRKEQQSVSAASIFETNGNSSDNSGIWHVVFWRALAAPSGSEPSVDLESGRNVPFAVLVWEGANEERAGLASMTPAWQQLEL